MPGKEKQMSETVKTSAEKLLANQVAAPEGTDPENFEPEDINTDEVVDDQEEQSTEPGSENNNEDVSEESEDELPETIKNILSKNRKAVREAEARAIAAEKALKEKEDGNESKNEAPVVDERFKNLYLASAAKTALVEAGLTKGTERFIKMIDINSLEVDEDGNVTGLEEQVAGLTTEFADLVTVREKKVPTAKVDGAGRRETPQAPKSSADLLAERLKK